MTTININGKEVLVHYGMRAMLNFFERAGKENRVSEMDRMSDMIYSGIECAYFMKEMPMPVTFMDVCLKVEELSFAGEEGAKQLKEALRGFEESHFMKKGLEEFEKENGKKKLNSVETK